MSWCSSSSSLITSSSFLASFTLTKNTHLTSKPNFFATPVTSKKKYCKCQLGDLAPATSVVYGALLLGGGVFAYYRSGSKGSIIGGLTGSSLMAASYFLMQTQGKEEIGYALGFGSALLFSAVFGIRLAASKKLIPSGPLLGLSIGAVAVFFSAYMQQNSSI